MSITFGSLFAGIGGFDLGLERAGMKCKWQVEIDPFCQRVLAKHWPSVERFSDVKECGKHNLEPVDLICGGFPCQPHSLAGKRRGAQDDRDLWPEYRRIVDELKPRWVLAENVPGIRTTILDQVLSDLENLNYTAGALVVPACAFNAPHIRKRVFIVAHANGGGLPKQGFCTKQQGGAETFGAGETLGNTKSIRHARQMGQSNTEQQAITRASWWGIEPEVGRVADGFPGRVDRIRALGNAVVPQVVEWLGCRIIEAINETSL